MLKYILEGGVKMSGICCFTGHREIKTLSLDVVASRLEKKLIYLIENEGFSDFRAGGAVGFDTLVALTVLKLKNQYPHIKLHLLLPCKNQDRFFTKVERNLYKYTLASADSITYMQEHYSREAMLARNRALVDGADLCISCLERLEGGTYYTVNYARKQRVPLVNVINLK